MTTLAMPLGGTDYLGPPFDSSVVEDLLVVLTKAVRAHQLYLHNNPMYTRATDSLRHAFEVLWQRTDEVALQVCESEFLWHGEALLRGADKASDNLAWLFYKDGVRELRLLPGFEQDEIGRLLHIIQRVRHASPESDDLLTLLWEEEFTFLRYRYVDLSLENAPPVDGSLTEDRPRLVEPPTVADDDSAGSDTHRPGIVNLDTFDATLYFLDEREIEYLQSEVAKVYGADQRRNVIAMLLDVFELQPDPAVRDEICGILDAFVLHLLSAGQFGAVGYLLREAARAADRGRAVSPVHRNLLGELPERLSEPSALAQLLQGLDEAAELPAQDELNELFDQLRPRSLGTAFEWLGRIQNVKLRTLLETAAARLASSNTGELVRLIASTSRAVSIEAMRRAGALRTAAAVAPLAKVIADADDEARLVAVQALAEIGSPGALQLLERTVDDRSRDIRVATARTIAARVHRPALARLESLVKAKSLRDADLTEKMAVFEAYGAVCGEAGLPLLDGLLHSKGFLGRREDPELRACAAMALGRIRSARAQESLRRAAAEKDVIVRNAVNRALRGGTT